MVPAVIEFDFDPALHLGDLAVRWEALALGLTIVICVALASVMAGRTSAVNAAYPEMGGLERGAHHLRRDDLLYILLGVVPAALLGGRLGYILIHWDFYSQHPEAWFDPTQGGLELSLAVVFGMLAGYAVAAGLGAPAGRWLHLATIPTLLGLTVGKAVGVVGATGQGAATNLDWATAYLGPGPWGSPDAATPAHPSQLLEAALSLLAMALIVFLLRNGRFRDHDGRVFFAAMSLWALTRVAAAFTWRDPVVVGPFGAAQVLGLTIAVVYFALFVLRAMYTNRAIRAIRAARARDRLPPVVPAVPAVPAAARAAERPALPPATATPATAAVGVPAPVAGATVEVERLAAAGTFVPDSSSAATSWRSGPVWLERLEPAPSAEAAVQLPAPQTVPGAPLVIRSVIVEPVAAEPVVGAAKRAAEVLEVAVAGPAPAPIEAVPAPIQPAPVAPVHHVPVIASPSPAVPIWQEIEHERPAPAEVVATSEQVPSEHGQPRHRTARELLAMAEAVRLAERVGRSAPVRMPPAVAIRASLAGVVAETAAPKPEPVQAAPATAVLVERLEAEVHIPAGVVPDDPLAPRTNLSTPTVVVTESSVAVERLEATEARVEAVTERVESAEPVPEAAEPEPVDTEPIVATVEPSVAARSLEPEPEPEARAAEPATVAPAELVTMEIEEVHRELVSAAAGPDDPLAPQHDLFEAMGQPADRFETPTEAPPELARAAGRANREHDAHHVIEASQGAIPLETAEPEPFAAAEPEPAAAEPEPAAAEPEPAAPEPDGEAELEPAAAKPAIAVAAAPARRGKPRRTVAQPKPKPLVEAVPVVEVLEAGAIASAVDAVVEAAPVAEPATETAAATELAGTGPDEPPPEFEASTSVEVESTIEPEPAAEVVPDAPAAPLVAPEWAEDAESEPRGTPPIDQPRERPRIYRPVRSRREYEERQRADEKARRAAQESPGWTAPAVQAEAESEARADEAGVVEPALDVEPDVEPAAVVEAEPALDPEPAVVEAEPALEPEPPGDAVPEAAAAPPAPSASAAEEAEADRRLPPPRPSRREPAPEPVAVSREPRPMDQEPDRRPHYVPARSRREYEQRQRAEEEARRAAQEPPAWTVRAMRREAQAVPDEGPKPLSSTALEQQQRMERAAEHRRRMRSRHASRRPMDEDDRPDD